MHFPVFVKVCINHNAATLYARLAVMMFGREEITTSSSAMAKRPRELGDFNGVGHCEAKF